MSNLQELNNAHFDKAAQDYDNLPQAKVFTQKSTEAILNGFKEATSEERLKNASVLDFGCGTGKKSEKKNIPWEFIMKVEVLYFT